MKKQLTSTEAAEYVYGNPGKHVFDCIGRKVFVSPLGVLRRVSHGLGEAEAGALGSDNAPFTLPADPDELPEDVRGELPAACGGPVLGHQCEKALTALWRHIKPETKR